MINSPEILHNATPKNTAEIMQINLLALDLNALIPYDKIKPIKSKRLEKVLESQISEEVYNNLRGVIVDK